MSLAEAGVAVNCSSPPVSKRFATSFAPPFIVTFANAVADNENPVEVIVISLVDRDAASAALDPITVRLSVPVPALMTTVANALAELAV